MLHKKSIKFGNLYYFKQKIDLCEVKKFVYVLNYLKSQGTKIIHRHTHRNKIKKPCWRQLPISTSLIPYGRRDSNRASFIFVFQKVKSVFPV